MLEENTVFIEELIRNPKSKKQVNIFPASCCWGTQRARPRAVYHRLTHSREKAMAPHSRTLAWKIPWMEEPGRL